MRAGLNLFLVASAALLGIGGFAVVARRSAVVSLFGAQFMLLAGALAFVAFGRFGLGSRNQNGAASVALVVGAAALAQLLIGVAMAAVLFRERRSFNLDPEQV
jgi:NADH:ubiquinone oxidoreductase subunit K